MKEQNRISRRDFVKTSAAATSFVAGASLLPGCGTPGGATPNVLFIITDQQHFDTIAAGGCADVKTPALDRLYKRSVSFKKSYTTLPVSSPARSSMFTGRPPSETGVHINERAIRDKMPNLGQWIREHTDYETTYVGKWHVPDTYQAEIEGFDVLYTGSVAFGYYDDTQKARICEGYLKNRDKKKPFFLVASFMQPHDVCEWLMLNMYPSDELPFDLDMDQLPELPENFGFDPREPAHIVGKRSYDEPTKGDWDERQYRFYRWSYYRQIEYLDGEIGRVLDALDESGYGENTLIIFTSDHGEGMGHHQLVRKSQPYDEASRVPFLISLPGQIEQNTMDSRNLVSGLDIVPTICDYLNIPAPPDMRGISLKSILDGNKVNREYVVTEFYGNAGRMIRSDQYKYVKYIEDPVEMLFDMENDPGEMKNLAFDEQYKTILDQHREWLSEWETSLNTDPEVTHAEYWKGVFV